MNDIKRDCVPGDNICSGVFHRFISFIFPRQTLNSGIF